MLNELDPNPRLRPLAPMDSLRSLEPTIPPTSHATNQSHRLTRELFSQLVEALKFKDKKQSSVSGNEDEGEDQAEVWEFGEEGFRRHATVFNGVIRSGARCLVRPRCARQVSR
jgi:hypothetical protein